MTEATAVSLIGVFDLLRVERKTISEAAEKCNEQDGQTYRVLGVIMKLVDGKTLCMAREIIEKDGEAGLDEAVYSDSCESRNPEGHFL